MPYGITTKRLLKLIDQVNSYTEKGSEWALEPNDRALLTMFLKQANQLIDELLNQPIRNYGQFTDKFNALRAVIRNLEFNFGDFYRDGFSAYD